MAADNKFDEMISIISVSIALLIEELENGGKVSILLDNKGNTNCNITLPHLECKSSMREVERREYRDIFSSSTTKQNAFATKPKGQSSEFHINANFAHSVCRYTDVRKIRHFSENSEELCGKRHIVVDIATNPSIGSTREVTNERFNKLDFSVLYSE